MEWRSEHQEGLLFALLEAVRLASGEDEGEVVSAHSEETSTVEELEPEFDKSMAGSSTPRPVPEHRKFKKGKKSRGHRCPTKLIPGGPCICCGARLSPQWRRPLEDDSVLCNACGIYYTRHKMLPERKPGAPTGSVEAVPEDDEEVAEAGLSKGCLDRMVKSSNAPTDKQQSGNALPVSFSSRGASVNTGMQVAVHAALLNSTGSLTAPADPLVTQPAAKPSSPSSHGSPSPSESSSYTPSAKKRPAPIQLDSKGPAAKVRRTAHSEGGADLAHSSPPHACNLLATASQSIAVAASKGNQVVSNVSNMLRGNQSLDETDKGMVVQCQNSVAQSSHHLSVYQPSNAVIASMRPSRTPGIYTYSAPSLPRLHCRSVTPPPIPTQHEVSALLHMMNPHGMVPPSAMQHMQHPHHLMGQIPMACYPHHQVHNASGINPHQMAILWSAMTSHASSNSASPHQQAAFLVRQAPGMGLHVVVGPNGAAFSRQSA